MVSKPTLGLLKVTLWIRWPAKVRVSQARGNGLRTSILVSTIEEHLAVERSTFLLVLVEQKLASKISQAWVEAHCRIWRPIAKPWWQHAIGSAAIDAGSPYGRHSEERYRSHNRSDEHGLATLAWLNGIWTDCSAKSTTATTADDGKAVVVSSDAYARTRLADYERWKPIYESDASITLQLGTAEHSGPVPGWSANALSSIGPAASKSSPKAKRSLLSLVQWQDRASSYKMKHL